MNAPLPHAALSSVQAANLAALPLIEKWEEYLSLNAEGNLADFGKWLAERESSKQSYAIEHQSTANKDAVAGYLIARLYKFIRLYSNKTRNICCY